MEELLTYKQVKDIEEFAKRNIFLKNPNLLNFGSDPTTIIKITLKHELIFVKGNKDTGFDHIHKRHEFWSDTSYWIESTDNNGNIKKRLQNQSKFRKDSIPFFDYAGIADSIYASENLNVDKNKHPDKFDLYTGNYTHKDNSTELYNLILYKNSKVVHTLYPQSARNNRAKPKKFNLARGKVSMVLQTHKNVVEITVPYIDSKKNVKYSLLIIKDLEKKMEKYEILIHDESGKPDKFYELGEQPYEDFNFSEIYKEEIKYQYGDLKSIEQIIKQIDKQLSEEKN